MKIRRLYTLTRNVYKVSLYTEDWSEGDKNLIANFGEPEVDIGGSFTGLPAYDLPSNLARIMTEVPFTQSFDGGDYADADDRANVWGTEVSSRIAAAVIALRTNADDFTREEVENV